MRKGQCLMRTSPFSLSSNPLFFGGSTDEFALRAHPLRHPDSGQTGSEEHQRCWLRNRGPVLGRVSGQGGVNLLSVLTTLTILLIPAVMVPVVTVLGILTSLSILLIPAV